MKKLLPIVFILILFSEVEAQNTYNTYFTPGCGYMATDPIDSSSIVGGYNAYTGEYQIFLDDYSSPYGHPWETHSSINTNTITYKIEVVSFPFTPNCVSCQIFFPPDSNRIFRMPDINFPYNASLKSWVRDTTGFPTSSSGSLSTVFLLRREFSGIYNNPAFTTVEGTDNIHFSALVSKFIVGASATEETSVRALYPHSILKHTFYMHCGDETQPIVDSFSFVLDHTRGRMRYYPFKGDNSPTSLDQHDISIYPTLHATASDSAYLNTIEYYPLINLAGACQNQNIIRPQPEMLLQVLLGNADGTAAAGSSVPGIYKPGIKHQYVVDKPIDLTLFNPSEKTIYNPSEVEIDLSNPDNPGSKTLIFPSGYIFKTVSGKYPTKSQVYAADPDSLYNDPREIPHVTTLTCDDAGDTTDNIFSYYYVKSGSTLKIESCVGIYDVQIVVENGATLTYDPQQTFGNFIIVQNPGSIVNDTALVGGDCAHDCYNINKYDVKNITIANDTTWTSLPFDGDGSGVMSVAGKIRIKAGKTLTINGGLEFEFGENASIIVERGAKLIVNGFPSDFCTFTSAGMCKKGMWQGIEVWGDRTVQQGGFIGLSSQGSVTLINVNIMNTRNGISTRNGKNTWDYTGGIIRCDSVVFKNNRSSVGFLSYHNKPTATTEIKNFSHLRNCKFLTTDYLNDPIYRTANGRRLGNVAQVTLWDVKDVTIENCLFENSAIKTDSTSLFDTDLRGAGIYAIDAGIRMRGDGYTNEFKGYSDAIWALSTGEDDFVWISGTSFKNNVHALTLEAIKSPRIELNNFEIPVHEANSSISNAQLEKGYNKPVGLYLISTKDFIAQENTFTNFGDTTTSSALIEEYNYGMVVNNCSGSSPIFGSDNGLGYAYKNIFSNVNVNLQTELDNKGAFNPLDTITPSVGGLEYKCNKFTTRINFDVTVPDAPGGIASLIRGQGLCASFDPQKQAGNSYTACSSSSSEQLDFGTSYSLGANSDFIYRDQPGVYSCTNLSSSIFPCPPFGLSSCLSNFSLCSTIPCLTTEYTNAQIAARQILDAYRQLLDGGNTTFLLQQINSSMPAGQLKNLLISKSPYLSDEVLIATLNRNDLPPYGHLEQIFIANSPVTQPVISALENVGLPSGVLNNIMSAQTGISARHEKESEVNYYAFQAKLAEVNLKQGYFKIENIDSVKAVSENDSTLSGMFKLIELLISQGDLSNARNCLNKIHLKEEGIHSDRCKLNGIRLNLAENNKSWFDMTPAQFNIIQQIYNNNPETAIEARSILALTKGFQYERYPFDVQIVRSISSSNQGAIENTNDLLAFKVYPNPGSDFTTVEINIDDKIFQGQLIVYNLLGAEILKQIVYDNEILNINTKDFNNGIYLYVLKSDKEIIEKQKVIISK